MRRIALSPALGFIFFICFSVDVYSQSGINTGINGMVINLPCNQNCITDPFKIPHIKSTSDYTVSTIPYSPYAFTSPVGNEDPNLYLDDTYSTSFTLPFLFCFYDSTYPQVVIGSNGLVTFDITNAGCANAFVVNQPIPYAVGTQCNGGVTTTYYPKASIMGAYSDLNPDLTDSPADRKIQWWSEGSAPFRRFIVSFYHIGVWNNASCNALTPNTFQMVMYESTGIVEIYVQQKACVPGSVGSSSGNAIMGIQNWARNKAVAAPGKNNQIWSETNTAYRFTPSGGASRFISSEILTLTGNFIANADTATTTTGLLDLSFPGFCPSGTSDQYIIRTTYAACDNGAPLMVDDTITINKTNNLNATAAVTPTSCAPVGTGTATIDIPAGIGTSPYTYVLNPGGISQTGNNMFNGLSAGNYSVVVTDASGGCSSTVPVNIINTGTLNVTYTAINTSCVGAANGSITVDPPVGTPPITYSINNGPYGSNNVFPNLAPGNYQIKVKDNGGCQATLSPVTVAAGAPITMTTSTTPTSCPGANNGSITITGSSGTGPFQYSINGGNYQANPTFNNLAPGTYFLSMKDAIGCTVTFQQATVTQGTGTLSGTASATATSCSGASNGSITVTPTTGSGPYEYTINNGANWQTSPTFNSLAAGTYTVKIREGGVCTSGNISATVNAGAALSGTASSMPTACAGVNNGSITVTAGAGFSGPFEYALDGGTFQTLNSFTGVSAGNHNVVIRNTAGCVSANIPVTVAAGTVLTGTVNAVNTSCSGATDGTITATATNGSGPYQYSLDGGPNQANSVFAGVAAGTHNIVITDNFGCVSAQLPVTVNAGPVLTGTASSTPTACAGVNNGSVSVIATTGFSGPFEYALDGGVFQTSNNFTGVSAGNHNVVIRNTAGCVSANIAVTVAAGTVLTGTVSAANTSCNGASDGTITATATNGSGPYQYSLDGGANQPTNIFTGVAAGAHSIVITDNFGCISAQLPVTVNSGTVLTGTASSSPTACAGVNNGSITITAGAAFTGPFEYSLNGGSFQTLNNFTGVAAGNHNVVIRNSSGCVSANIPVTVSAGNVLTGTVTAGNTSCNGASDGTITANASNGSGPYLYSLDGGANQTSNVFTGVGSGTHNVTITDNFGCISGQLAVTVNAGSALTGTATSTSTACTGVNNGSITVTAGAGFTGPFEYALDGGAFQTSNNFTGVAAGAHNVVIKNTAGCTSGNISVTVNAGTTLNGTAIPTVISCNGASDGVITATPANGSAPYQYSLDGGPGQGNNVFTNLSAGSHSVMITDAFGCTSAPIPVTITQPAPLVAPTPVTTRVICNGGNNGSITVNPTGGTSPYTYSLDNANFQPSNVFAVSQGSYTVYVKDSKGCSMQFNNVTVTEPAPLIANVLSTTDASCNGGSDGVIEIAANGGTAPYQYSFDGVAFQSSNILNVPAGTYPVAVKDANNCRLDLPPVVIGLTDNLTISTSVPAPICEGNSVQLQVNGNATNYTWTGGTSGDLSSTTVPNPIASPKTSTTYTVTATLGSCTKSGQVTVNVMPAPIPDAGAAGNICFGQNYQLQASGGTTYTWTPSTYLDNTAIANPQSVKPEKTITYTLSVKDANNCPSLITDDVTITVTPPIQVFTSPVDTVVYAGDQFGLLAVIPGSDTSYKWTPSIGLSDPNVSTPTVTALNVGDIMTYKVTVTTSAGCQGEAYVTVKVYEGPELYVATAFTPNGDGKNDIFIPFPVGIKQLNYFRVFNRWGQQLYYTKTLNQGWDGTMNGVEQGSGVYIWMAEAVTENGAIIKKKGTITLIR